MISLADQPLHKLQEIAQGCTEFSCPYHGEVNIEIRRRGNLHE